MLQAERRSRIVAELQERPAVSVGELAELVGTSEMTIRRDLSALASAGLVRKVHGGAVAVRHQAQAFDAVGMVNVRAKQAIAAEAASLVPDRATVVLNGGTTVGMLASALRGRQLTVLTNSLMVLRELHDERSIAIHLVGGHYRPETQSVTGPQVAEALGDFSADLAFLATSAIRDGSFYTYHPEDAIIQRRMIEIARAAWLLADSSKLQARGLGRVGPLTDLSGVITDSGASAEQLAEIERWAPRVMVAPVERQAPAPCD
jgi:DeoR family fructose operon transcriptional repressor